MSSKTLEGMAVAYEARIQAKTPWEPTEPMRCALLWLASNVSDEMVEALWADNHNNGSGRSMLTAALRAAAGENALSTTGDENA